MSARRILLIIGGGIAAYKCLELIRRGRERGLAFRCVLTRAATEFVTPLSVASLAGEKAFTDLFSLTDEAEIGHIRLSREADLVVVAPATADLMAKMAQGQADDLATTALLATDKPVLIAPAMNPRMWDHPATRRNVEFLRADGVHFVGPATGAMAEGEVGPGRMAEPPEILAAIERLLDGADGPAGRPASDRHERADARGDRPGSLHCQPLLGPAGARDRPGPGRGRGCRDAGGGAGGIARPARRDDRQGRLGPRHAGGGPGQRCRPISPVCAAAVADWRPAMTPDRKIKKESGPPPPLELVENPDILRTLAQRGEDRPGLVIGFAAETGDLLAKAKRKLERKGCDWILANDVSRAGVFGGVANTVHLLTRDGAVESWPELDKLEVARRLVARVAASVAEAGR